MLTSLPGVLLSLIAPVAFTNQEILESLSSGPVDSYQSKIVSNWDGSSVVSDRPNRRLLDCRFRAPQGLPNLEPHLSTQDFPILRLPTMGDPLSSSNLGVRFLSKTKQAAPSASVASAANIANSLCSISYISYFKSLTRNDSHCSAFACLPLWRKSSICVDDFA